MTTSAFDSFAKSFLGLDQRDRVHEQSAPARRVYLDTTATALMPAVVWRGLERYLETACANSHTEAHRAGRDTTRAIEDSRDAIGKLVGYDPGRDVVLLEQAELPTSLRQARHPDTHQPHRPVIPGRTVVRFLCQSL